MASFLWLFLSLASILTVFAEIDYTTTCGTPTCYHYFDGCNDCMCNLGTGTMACTERACFAEGTPYCGDCENGAYWLRFDTFQSRGYPTCDSRLSLAPALLQNNSKCACPRDYPYWEEGVGCINEEGCDVRRLRPRHIFTYEQPQSGDCAYDYKLCKSDDDCYGDLVCNIPEDNYKTCIPLSAQLDENCELSDCNKCLFDDCMGTGYGYCSSSTECEVGGCNSEICAANAEDMLSRCDWRCEYGCLQYKECGRMDNQGTCGWKSINRASERAYKQCMEHCQRTPSPTSICTLPVETGPCRAAISRWFYNPEYDRCEPFTYGGCGGNANNFDTYTDCQHACMLIPDCCPRGYTFVAKPETCARMRYICESGMKYWDDGICGCGCKPDCVPDGYSYRGDPDKCATIGFVCEEGYEYWSDSECGCGCKPAV